jgi:EpsI family protein
MSPGVAHVEHAIGGESLAGKVLERDRATRQEESCRARCAGTARRNSSRGEFLADPARLFRVEFEAVGTDGEDGSGVHVTDDVKVGKARPTKARRADLISTVACRVRQARCSEEDQDGAESSIDRAGRPDGRHGHGGTGAATGSACRGGHGRLQLETLVPTEFGTWKMVRESGTQVVNPQTQQLLDKLYSQILSRTYVDASGYRIMLSLAYGDDQRGRPAGPPSEVCYPAQGFKVRSTVEGTLATPVRRRQRATPADGPRPPCRADHLLAHRWRHDHSQHSGRSGSRKSARLDRPDSDGLLFRISSIDGDPKRAFAAQQRFTADLLAAVPASARKAIERPRGPRERELRSGGRRLRRRGR